MASRSITSILFIIFTVLPTGSLMAKYGGGSGDPCDPYLIYDPCQLNAIGTDPCDLDKHFELRADIDLSRYSGTAFNIIGHDWMNRFDGTFDGKGHSILNFTYTSDGGDYVSLFGHLRSPHALIKNVTIINPILDGGSGAYIAGLVGRLGMGTIQNCHVIGGDLRGRWVIGGLVGWNEEGTIENCSAATTVTGVSDYIGGLVGYNGFDTTTILNSNSDSVVTGNDHVGGLVGGNDWTGLIANCYAMGTVTGMDNIGGLMGSSELELIRSYSAAAIISNGNNIGGLIGRDNGGTYTKCFWDNTINPALTGIGNLSLPDVTGRSTQDMQEISTYISSGWDFLGEDTNGITDIWRMCVNGVDYPRFTREYAPGDSDCPDGINITDLAYLSARWLETGCEESLQCRHIDLDHSGGIDMVDLSLWIQNWMTEDSP